MRKTAAVFVLLAAFVAGSASTANARPPHRKALADHFGPLLHKKLNDCRTCHEPPRPGAKGDQAEDMPHNAFGARLKQVRKELARAGKKTTGILFRIEAIA